MNWNVVKLLTFIKPNQSCYCPKKLFFHGDATKFDRKRLKAELARCRETGYAFDMGELNVGINVIASPVFDSQRRVIGSMFIMGIFSEAFIEEYGSIVAESAKHFSSLLGADIGQTYGNEERRPL